MGAIVFRSAPKALLRQSRGGSPLGPEAAISVQNAAFSLPPVGSPRAARRPAPLHLGCSTALYGLPHCSGRALHFQPMLAFNP